jgi:hypothetical protein
LDGLYRAAEARPPVYIEHPAVVFWARNASGQITGFQRVVITPDGSDKADRPGFKPSTGALA